MRCLVCGAMAPAGAHFCPGCGASLDALTPAAKRGVEGELRQLTVVFCDLVGSTQLSRRLDPEELGDITVRYHQQVVEVVERYGGEVVRYLGDGMLIEFGWPVAHDDDSERAVRAAIDIAAAVETVNQELLHDVSLAVRIGVHTGPVLVGELGGGAYRQRMALGETMNMAARLQEAAPPGAVVISQTTRRLVRGIFVTEELQPQTFKGFSGPITLHRVLQPSGVPSRFDETSGRLSPFVGRESDVQGLVELWASTQKGSGGAKVIFGEPGVGKSRLVYEFRQRVKDSAHSWLECRCSSYTRHSAFRPMIDMVERGLGFQPEDGPDVRRGKLERALQRTVEDPDALALMAPLLSLPSPSPSPRVTPEYRRSRTLEVIAQWARALAGLQPLILLVEDLQWADASTLELFEHLADSAPEIKLMVIGTARPEFRSSGSALTEADIVDLEPLAEAEIHALVSRLAGGRPVPQPVLERITADAAGIPLFAEEITYMLLESGVLVEREDRLELTVPLERLEIPVTLHDSLMARLDRAGEAKHVAQVAAVVGREFDPDLLGLVANLENEAVRRRLDELVSDQLLYKHGESPQATYTFKHALIQEAAYGSLLKRTRRELHARTALVLDERAKAGAPDFSYEVIARHYRAAGELPQAIEAYGMAATQSAGRSGYAEAAEHLKRALTLISELPDAEAHTQLEPRCRFLNDLGDAYWNTGNFEAAQEAFREAADLASRLGLPEQLARAALGFGGRMAFGTGFRDETLIKLLQAALLALDASQVELQAQVMARLAEALAFSDSRERRADLCKKAERLARRLGDPRTLASVLAHEHWALWSPDNLERRLAISQEIVRGARTAHDRVLEVEGRLWLVMDLMESSQTQAAEREFNQWLALAQQSPQQYQRWLVEVLKATQALMHGQIDEAERLALAALEIGQQDRNQNALQVFGVQIAGVRREQARYHELEEPLKVFIEQYTAIPTWRCALAFLYAESGRRADAQRQLDHLAADNFSHFRRDHFWLPDLTLAGDSAGLLGDVERSRALYELLVPYEKRCVMTGPIAACWGSTSRTLGSLAATLERWEDADRHFEDGIAHNYALGARLWLTRTRLEYAESLVSRHRRLGPGPRDERLLVDHHRAHELLTRVLKTARRLSLVDPERKALDLLGQLQLGQRHVEAQLG